MVKSQVKTFVIFFFITSFFGFIKCTVGEQPQEMKLTIREKSWKKQAESLLKCKIDIHKGYIYQGHRDVLVEKGSLKFTFYDSKDTSNSNFNKLSDSITLLIGKSFFKIVEHPEDYKYFECWFEKSNLLNRRIYDIENDCLRK